MLFYDRVRYTSAKNEQEKQQKFPVEVWCVFLVLPFRQKN